jgi:hypothetical protein
MADETWAPGELVRTIKRIDESVGRIETRLTNEFVRKDVWTDYKQQVAVNIIDLEAEQARIRKEHRADLDGYRVGQRWAVGIALTAATVVVAGAGLIINAMGMGA